ncbi:MAG: glycosyl hydrolase, partial [Gemmatimonadetes bacterium]|nr:glycosyl hydrolase [Gemmatimonadota bacterium]
YYTRIYADPIERDVVYVLNTGFYQSRDGGETFPRSYRVPHGDNHDLWIAPTDNQRMINANDGGGNVSFNGGDTWTDQDYSTAQFYRVTTTNHEPYHVCGAQQDNSTACTPSGGWNHLSNDAGGPNFLYSIGGCESGYIAPHPEDTDVFYAGCYGGSLSRYDHETGLTRSINVWPENPMGQSAEDLVERVQWTFPIVFSPHDADLLFTGTQKVWRTTTEGQSWQQISPDLTRAEPMTVGPSGGPITLDQTGVETYATVFAIAPSPHDADVIWAGSDDGLVHVTRDGTSDQPSWTNVTPPDAPDFVRINTIEASPHTPGKAYVSGIRYLVDDDRAPYVWMTEDYGQSWTKIVSGIEDDHFVRAVREDIVQPGLLYAATEETVYVSWDDGANWNSLALNLPNVQVSDLVVEDHDLVIGTHGRSFWILRGIDPLRQISSDMMGEAPTVLFDPKDPVRRFDNSVQFLYHLAEDAERVTFEFIGPDGEVIQTFASDGEVAGGGGFGGFGGGRPSASEGSHRYSWNMRYPGYTDFEGRIFWAAGNQGPAALPGTYVARMTVDGTVYEQDFEIQMNPRAVAEGVTMADLQERFDFAMQIRDRVSQANEAVLRIRAMKEQIDARQEEADNAELQALGDQVEEKLGAVEGEVYQVRNQSNQDPLNFPIKLNNKIAALLGGVEGAENRPTDQAYDVFGKLTGELDAQLELLTIIIQQDLQQLNELLQSLGLDPIETENLIS